MRIRIGRAVSAALVAEVLGVAMLALLVAIFGPPGFTEAQPFAEQLGRWVGPISGLTLCILGGYWVARDAAPTDKLLNGLAMGLTGAALDLAIAIAFGVVLSPLLLVSNAGRILGGSVGGWLARRHAAASCAQARNTA